MIQETYISNFTENYSPIFSSNNQICCIPSLVSFAFIDNTSNFNVTATFSQESLSTPGCNGMIFGNETYVPSLFNANSTVWTSPNGIYVFVMDTNSPGYIQAILNISFYDRCIFNMSLTTFGEKLAKSSIVSIIGLLIISIWH